MLSFDEKSVLTKSVNDWQLCQWNRLINLKIDDFKEYKKRKKIILLVYSGYIQVGKNKKAQKILEIAKQWGCSEKNIKKIVVSNLYKSLGDSKISLKTFDEALQYYKKSIKLITPKSDVEFIAKARMILEMNRVGLLIDALATTKELHEINKFIIGNEFYQLAHKKVIDIEIETLRDRVYSLQQQYYKSKQNSPIHEAQKSSKEKLNEKSKTTDKKTYYGLHQLDKKLEPYIDYDNGYFVELGANDGITQSNTYYFEKERSWTGLLIEPILHNFLKCKQTRSDKNFFACCACVSFEYKKPYIELMYSNLMTTPLNVESDLKNPEEHAEFGKVYLRSGEEPIRIMAPTRTLTSLLDDAKAPQIIDLLSLDVEGAEIEVLKGIDFKKYKFKYLLVESRNEEVLENYLVNYGYKLIDKLSQHDCLFELDNEKN